MDNYYAILGVSPSADLAVIKQAYYKQLKTLHPDLNPHPASHYLTIRLNKAFTILSQPDLRLIYDQSLYQSCPLPSPASRLTHLSFIILWCITLALIYYIQQFY